jgi:signal transduction histidine kinase
VALVQPFLDSFFFENLTTPFVAMLFLLYTVGRHETGRRMWLELAIVTAGLWVGIAFTDEGAHAEDVLWTVLLLSPPALAGRAIRSRVLLRRELRAKARRLEAEQDVRARRAVEDERVRIASELQAVVANGLSAMVVQAEGVPRVLDAGNSARAAHALELIEETGRDALAEMRRLLGVLRRDDDEPALAPQPSLSGADALVQRMGTDGVTVALRVDGHPVDLPAGVDLAAYRVLQEALASAIAADGVSGVDVRIDYGERDVTVLVRDDRAGDGDRDASSLMALRERVGLYGGVLRTGARRSGRGFRVEARLPLGGHP